MDLKEHFKELYREHGNSPKSVHWTDTKTQEKRFEILLEVDRNLESVMDVGCGLGDMYKYLLSRGYKGKYCGTDFVEEFIQAASKNFTATNAVFKLNDIKNEELPSGYDYVLLSGVFNNKTGDNKEFMLDTINKMFAACKKGIAFNAMSTYVDYQDEILYYSDPLEVFDYCKKNLTRKVTLRHDYLVKQNSIPYEYALYLYK